MRANNLRGARRGKQFTNTRLHGALDHLPPLEYERKLARRPAEQPTQLVAHPGQRRVTTSVTTPAAGHAVCPVCGTGFTRVRRQAYCTPACDSAAATVVVPAGQSRRDVTVYACTECDQRYLGLQWCPDCQRPCTRIGHGGLCRDCGEPMTVDELLNTRDDQYLTSKIR